MRTTPPSDTDSPQPIRDIIEDSVESHSTARLRRDESRQIAARRKRPFPFLRWVLLGAFFIAVVMLSATLGAPIPLADLWSNDESRARIAQQIFWRFEGDWGLRPVRIMAAIFVGASLATSGAALQAVFRNPLAEPYLLGISSGGALGATLGLALQNAAALRVLQHRAFDASAILAFCGALAATILVYVLGQSRAGNSSGVANRSTLLLTGVAVSAFLSALMALVVSLGQRADLAQQVMFWMLGGLVRATSLQNPVLLYSFGIGFAILLFSARDLNALRAGDEDAMTLGVPLVALHRRLLFAAALMSAAAVATAGLIGFVGLLAPHLVRLLFGSDARVSIPASALCGAALLVGCDAVARSVARPVELPVGIVTALLGVPLFLFLARRA